MQKKGPARLWWDQMEAECPACFQTWILEQGDRPTATKTKSELTARWLFSYHVKCGTCKQDIEIYPRSTGPALTNTARNESVPEMEKRMAETISKPVEHAKPTFEQKHGEPAPYDPTFLTPPGRVLMGGPELVGLPGGKKLVNRDA